MFFFHGYKSRCELTAVLLPACAYAGIILLINPSIGIYSPVLQTMGLVGWSLELCVNICVTIAIAGRLWYMGMRLSRATSTGASEVTRSNTYASSILTLIESGAILIAVTVTILILYKTGNAAALVCTDIATQLSVSFPKL